MYAYRNNYKKSSLAKERNIPMELTHILLLQPKPETTPEQYQAGITALVALKEKIPGILAVETHKSFKIDPRGGFTDIVIFTFESETYLAAYMQHPEHLAVIQENRPFLGSVVAFDYASGTK
jgi:hypothetical protein